MRRASERSLFFYALFSTMIVELYWSFMPFDPAKSLNFGCPKNVSIFLSLVSQGMRKRRRIRVADFACDLRKAYARYLIGELLKVGLRFLLTDSEDCAILRVSYYSYYERNEGYAPLDTHTPIHGHG